MSTGDQTFLLPSTKTIAPGWTKKFKNNSQLYKTIIQTADGDQLLEMHFNSESTFKCMGGFYIFIADSSQSITCGVFDVYTDDNNNTWVMQQYLNQSYGQITMTSTTTTPPPSSGRMYLKNKCNGAAECTTFWDYTSFLHSDDDPGNWDVSYTIFNDIYGNSFQNNAVYNLQSNNLSVNPYVMNAQSGKTQVITGSVTSGKVQLPSLAQYGAGVEYRIINQNTNSISIYSDGTTNIATVPTGSTAVCVCTATGTPATWIVTLSNSTAPVSGVTSLTGDGVLINNSSSTGAVTLTRPTVSGVNKVYANDPTTSNQTPSFRALVGSDLPNPSTSTKGGVQAINAVTSNWIDSINSSGVPHLSQPNFTDISGTASSAQLPNPTTSAKGGVQAVTPVTNQWVNSIDTSGVPQLSRPDFSNLSGNATVSQGGTGLTSTTTNSLIAGGSTSTGNLQQVSNGTSGQVLTSNGAGSLPSFQTSPANVSSLTGDGTLFDNSASTGAVTLHNKTATTNSVLATNSGTSYGFSNNVSISNISTGTVVNVKYFGAVGNGTTDDTAAINSAISAIPYSSGSYGGVVYFPSGQYKITSTISITTNSLTLLGDGRGTQNGSCILSTAAAGAAFDLVAFNGCQFSGIENMELFNVNFPTAGFGVNISNSAYEVFVRKVDINGLYNGISISSSTESRLEEVTMRSLGGIYGTHIYGNSTTGSYRAYLKLLSCDNPNVVAENTASNYANNTAYSVGNYLIAGSIVYQVTVAGTSALSGTPSTRSNSNFANGSMQIRYIGGAIDWLVVDSYAYSIIIDSCNFIHGIHGVTQIDSAGLGESSYPTWVQSFDLECDHNLAENVYLAAGTGFQVSNGWFGSTFTGNGIDISSTYAGEVLIATSRIWGIQQTGILVNGGKNVSILNNTIGAVSVQGSNLFNGITLANGITNVTIVGNNIGADERASPLANMGYGIFIGTGCSNYSYDDNNITNFGLAKINDASHASSQPLNEISTYGTTGQVVTSNGSGAAPTWTTLANTNLPIIDVSHGGTGLSSLASGSLIYGSGSNPVSTLTIGANGTQLISNGSVPSWGYLSVNNVNQTANLNGNLVLSNTSAMYQYISAYTSGNILLPNATTCVAGQTFYIINASATTNIPLQDSSGSSFGSGNIYARSCTGFFCTSSGGANNWRVLSFYGGGFTGQTLNVSVGGLGINSWSAQNSLLLTGSTTALNTAAQVVTNSSGGSGIPLISGSSNTVAPSFGTALVPGGGTGLTSTTTYGLIAGGTTSTGNLQQVATGTSGQVLVSGGSSALPSFGTVGVAGGGSGLSTLTTYALLTGGTTSTGALQQVATGTSGKPLISAGSAALPAFGTLGVSGGGTGITSVASNSLLLGSGGSVLNTLAIGSDTNILQIVSGVPNWVSTSQGTGTVSITSTGTSCVLSGVTSGYYYSFCGGGNMHFTLWINWTGVTTQGTGDLRVNVSPGNLTYNTGNGFGTYRASLNNDSRNLSGAGLLSSSQFLLYDGSHFTTPGATSDTGVFTDFPSGYLQITGSLVSS